MSATTKDIFFAALVREHIALRAILGEAELKNGEPSERAHENLAKTFGEACMAAELAAKSGDLERPFPRAPKLGENIIGDPELNELRRAQEAAAAVSAVLECAIYEVVQAAKSAKEAARIGTDARIAIGRLRADVQHSVNVGESMTVEAILARLDGIVEGRS